MGRLDGNTGDIDDELMSRLNAANQQMSESNAKRAMEEAIASNGRTQGIKRQRKAPEVDDSFDAFDDSALESLDESDDIQLEESELSNRRRPRRDEFESPRRRSMQEEEFESPRRRPRREEEEFEAPRRRPRREEESEEVPNRRRPRQEEPELDVPDDFSLDDEEDSGPISLDRPQKTGRRRPMMDEDDEEFVPRKRSKKSVGGILSKIHLQPKYVAIIIAVVAFFIIGSFLDSKSSDDETMAQLDDVENSIEMVTSDKGVSENESTETSEVGGSAATTVERGELLNDTSVSYSKEVYDDEIAVSKFLEFRGASCIPKFMGYSDVLQREIEFQVSAEDYNKYLNGVKINVTYRALEKDGITYVTDIKIKK